MSCYELEFDPAEQAQMNSLLGEIWTVIQSAKRAKKGVSLDEVAEEVVLDHGFPPDDTLIDELIQQAVILERIVEDTKKEYSIELPYSHKENLGYSTYAPRSLDLVHTAVVMREIRDGDRIRATALAGKSLSILQAEIPNYILIDKEREAQAERWNEAPSRVNQPT